MAAANDEFRIERTKNDAGNAVTKSTEARLRIEFLDMKQRELVVDFNHGISQTIPHILRGVFP